MSKIGLIIKREYLRRVSKKSFLLLTLLTPFLFAAIVFTPLWLSSLKGDTTYTVAIVDTTGKYAALFENTDSYRFISSEQKIDEQKNGFEDEVFAYLNITGDLLDDPTSAMLYSRKQIPNELSRIVNQTISSRLEEEKLATFNIPGLKDIIQESKIKFDIKTMKWGEDGSEKQSSTQIATIIGGIFTMLIYMFIMIYGAMVMQGVMEEKTNRIVEIMISSVKPFDLMMGKIVGIGMVGLTQVFLWGIMTSALIAGSSASMAHEQAVAIASQEAGYEWTQILEAINLIEIGLLFILYFIGGYLLYSSLFAAIGSAVDSQEDTQQFMIPVTMLLMFGLYTGIYSMENPDGPMAFWCSIIPFTSPIVMMVRAPFDVPLWEQILSIGLLYASAIGLAWISGKIYRVGILMYGKKPSIKEIIKWVRYK